MHNIHDIQTTSYVMRIASATLPPHKLRARRVQKGRHHKMA